MEENVNVEQTKKKHYTLKADTAAIGGVTPEEIAERVAKQAEAELPAKDIVGIQPKNTTRCMMPGLGASKDELKELHQFKMLRKKAQREQFYKERQENPLEIRPNRSRQWDVFPIPPHTDGPSDE